MSSGFDKKAPLTRTSGAGVVAYEISLLISLASWPMVGEPNETSRTDSPLIVLISRFHFPDLTLVMERRGIILDEFPPISRFQTTRTLFLVKAAIAGEDWRFAGQQILDDFLAAIMKGITGQSFGGIYTATHCRKLMLPGSNRPTEKPL